MDALECLIQIKMVKTQYWFLPLKLVGCDIISFFKEKTSVNAIQALEKAVVYYISLLSLEELFLRNPKFERFSVFPIKMALNFINAGSRLNFIKPQKNGIRSSESDIPGWNDASHRNKVQVI